MTALLVPLGLDVLLVRADGTAFAPTKMKTPQPNPQKGERQKLVPEPFGADTPRAEGAYLHWSMPDGLTQAQHTDGSSAPVFPAIPDRWLVLRLTGDATAGPRTVTAWMLPDVNAATLEIRENVLGSPGPGPNPPPAKGKPFTVLGTGDLSWSAYFDNVLGQLSLYDPLTGVDGAVSYVVCGWYTRVGIDPINDVNDATFSDFMEERRWRLPNGVEVSGNRPTSIVTHGAALAMGWPDPAWPGDGGTLGLEAGGPPQGGHVDVVVADTIAEATASLSVAPDGAPADPQTRRLVQAALEVMLSALARTDGPATLDTSLHMSRFASLASEINSETIWESNDAPTASAARSSATSPAALRRSAPGLAGAIASSEALAGVAARDDVSGPDVGGSLVSADRSAPRVFAPTDPVLLLRGAGRSFAHGGDGRFNHDQTLSCRLSADTVTSFRAPGQPAEDASAMLPAQIASQLAALGVPSDVLPLLQEAVCLDPSSASDLATATTTATSADAAARAAWLDDPSTIPSQGVVGRLPSPVAAVGAVHPWTPVHAEWRLEWMPAVKGVHGFVLGSVDFELPTAGHLPEVGAPQLFAGRALLTGSPAKIAGGGVAQALSHLRERDLLEQHPVGSFVASTASRLAEEGGRAAFDGLEGAAADQDLLSGSLEDFLAQLRDEDTDPMVRPPSSGDGQPGTDASRPKNPDVVRAGLARVRRLRIVDAFGQYVDLLGSSHTTPADDSAVVVGVSQAVEGVPGLVALVPRINAKARVLMRYTAADGAARDADTATSPLCGFVLPSPIDGSLEFFDAAGIALGRIRADERHGAAWEEDPGQPASFGRKPSSAIPSKFLGQIADSLLAWDTELAVGRGPTTPQTALEALNQLIDTTRWTVDSTGSSGDEHLALLLGHPVAVLRAAIRIDVQGAAANSNAGSTAVPLKLGTLAHTQDGLLAYFVDDDYTRARAVDPSIGSVAPPGGTTITSGYVDLSPSFDVQPEQVVPLTLLVVPGTDIHVTTGLLPQKQIGMRRDWVSAPLASLTPNWRYGPVLLDPKVTRVPVASDVRGIWTWYHRPDPVSWAPEGIVNADATAILADDKAVVQHGWVRLQLQPDPDFPGIPVEVRCIRKPIRDAVHRIQGVGGLNGDGTPWFITTEEAIQMIESGRFFLYVTDSRNPLPEGSDGRVRIITGISARGNKFIQTVGDNDPVNDLNSLPECPK
jgi:hypothetical protein